LLVPPTKKLGDLSPPVPMVAAPMPKTLMLHTFQTFSHYFSCFNSEILKLASYYNDDMGISDASSSTS